MFSCSRFYVGDLSSHSTKCVTTLKRLQRLLGSELTEHKAEIGHEIEWSQTSRFADYATTEVKRKISPISPKTQADSRRTVVVWSLYDVQVDAVHEASLNVSGEDELSFCLSSDEHRQS
ncbi:unnamed protein product [Protopolystoma xenopodis]|uniref:Uncharacterized protein n=1 Tax=Protopolystoma xenopodis TaxID=117903 RepID=A0A448X2T2_9PLAT|nr:unnamed protein product [Protopolystoma xenopodis]